MTTIEIIADLYGMSENDASAYIAERAFYAEPLEIQRVVAAIEKARAEEREACARIALRASIGIDKGHPLTHKIAASIRARNK